MCQIQFDYEQRKFVLWLSKQDNFTDEWKNFIVDILKKGSYEENSVLQMQLNECRSRYLTKYFKELKNEKI